MIVINYRKLPEVLNESASFSANDWEISISLLFEVNKSSGRICLQSFTYCKEFKVDSKKCDLPTLKSWTASGWQNIKKPLELQFNL